MLAPIAPRRAHIDAAASSAAPTPSTTQLVAAPRHAHATVVAWRRRLAETPSVAADRSRSARAARARAPAVVARERRAVGQSVGFRRALAEERSAGSARRRRAARPPRTPPSTSSRLQCSRGRAALRAPSAARRSARRAAPTPPPRRPPSTPPPAGRRGLPHERGARRVGAFGGGLEDDVQQVAAVSTMGASSTPGGAWRQWRAGGHARAQVKCGGGRRHAARRHLRQSDVFPAPRGAAPSAFASAARLVLHGRARADALRLRARRLGRRELLLVRRHLRQQQDGAVARAKVVGHRRPPREPHPRWRRSGAQPPPTRAARPSSHSRARVQRLLGARLRRLRRRAFSTSVTCASASAFAVPLTCSAPGRRALELRALRLGPAAAAVASSRSISIRRRRAPPPPRASHAPRRGARAPTVERHVVEPAPTLLVRDGGSARCSRGLLQRPDGCWHAQPRRACFCTCASSAPASATTTDRQVQAAQKGGSAARPRP